jgi:hypothetical protein
VGASAADSVSVDELSVGSVSVDVVLTVAVFVIDPVTVGRAMSVTVGVAPTPTVPRLQVTVLASCVHVP